MSNKDSYDRIADQWDRVRSCRPVDHCVEEFADLLPKGAAVMDIGCGTGRPIGAYLINRGFQLTAMDISPRMLDLARANLPGAQLILGDFLDFDDAPFEGAFDGILAFDSLFHVAGSRQKEIYPKVSRLLAKGGYFLFTGGFSKGPDQMKTITGTMLGQTFTYGALSESELLQALKESGLSIIRFEKQYTHPTTGSRDLLCLARKD